MLLIGYYHRFRLELESLLYKQIHAVMCRERIYLIFIRM